MVTYLECLNGRAALVAGMGAKLLPREMVLYARLVGEVNVALQTFQQAIRQLDTQAPPLDGQRTPEAAAKWMELANDGAKEIKTRFAVGVEKFDGLLTVADYMALDVFLDLDVSTALKEKSALKAVPKDDRAEA